MRFFYTGKAELTQLELDIYMQFVLLDVFHVRPWEYSEDHEIYREDLATCVNLKRLQQDAEISKMEKTQWRAEAQGRLSRKWG